MRFLRGDSVISFCVYVYVRRYRLRRYACVLALSRVTTRLYSTLAAGYRCAIRRRPQRSPIKNPSLYAIWRVMVKMG
jgi:hypothetical protein